MIRFVTAWKGRALTTPLDFFSFSKSSVPIGVYSDYPHPNQFGQPPPQTQPPQPPQPPGTGSGGSHSTNPTSPDPGSIPTPPDPGSSDSGSNPGLVNPVALLNQFIAKQNEIENKLDNCCLLMTRKMTILEHNINYLMRDVKQIFRSVVKIQVNADNQTIHEPYDPNETPVFSNLLAVEKLSDQIEGKVKKKFDELNRKIHEVLGIPIDYEMVRLFMLFISLTPVFKQRKQITLRDHLKQDVSKLLGLDNLLDEEHVKFAISILSID
jgi:hypothetical protein